MDSFYLNQIKNFEGYAREAKWDYAQHSNGYGTKAAYPGEVISKAEADRRFRDEISKAAALVDNFAPGLDAGSRAALTSLTFNAGTKWMKSGLGDAIKSGNLGEAKNIFLKYTKAGGEDLPGLVNRRLEEVGWFPDIAASSSDREVMQDDIDASTAHFIQNRDGTHVVAAEIPYERTATDGTFKSIAAAHDLFEQLQMDRVRLLVLSERNAGSEAEDENIL